MFPLISDGDQIEIEYFQAPKELKTQRPGQIVLVRPDTEWVLHRVVQCEKGLGTKGDWSMGLDADSLVWGQLKSINGKTTMIIQDPLLSFYSEKISNKNPRFVRVFFRVLLFWLAMNKKRRLVRQR